MRSKILRLVFGRFFFTLGLLLFIFPIVWEIGTNYEGEYFPVVRRIPDLDNPGEKLPIIYAEFPGNDEVDKWVDVFVQFRKVRSCEYFRDLNEAKGVIKIPDVTSSFTWYDKDGRRLKIRLDLDQYEFPETRPKGDQITGPWRIYGISSVEGTRAITAHKCHPLWLTYSVFYPRDIEGIPDDI